MTSTISPHRQQLLQQRNELRAELTSAIEDEADPLAAYDNFVKWTLQNYANHSESGLLELLEEAVRKFLNDVRYKTGDLRYVKLWILFANHVEKPTDVYSYMFQEGIGKPYALFFEEYAEALEREGRFGEAETVIALGLRTQARPQKHLQAFHSDYTERRSTGKKLRPKVSPFREGAYSHSVAVIRAHPLQNIASRHTSNINHAPLGVPTTSHHDVSMTTTQAIRTIQNIRLNPYVHLNAPPAPGRKTEKLQFDLTLLLDPDGTEYCFEEARARHLGLLGKKWPPPPPPLSTSMKPVPSLNKDERAPEHSVKVNFNDQGSKAVRPARRQSVTVTINTKQALEDVFDMYNSPTKERGDGEEPKDQASPSTEGVYKSQSTPASGLTVFRDENAGVIVKPRAFQPYVDQRRENATPAPLKFMPVTTKTPTTNAFTPSTARKALVAKEITTPVPAFKVVRPELSSTTPTVSSDLRSVSEEQEPDETDVFGGDDIASGEFTEDFTNPPPPPPPPRTFVPFVDENPGLPTASQNENVPGPVTSKILKFQVHRDENAAPARPLRQPASASQVVYQTPFRPIAREEPVGCDDGAEASQDDLDTEYEEHRFAKSGRFADFDVMTPITERTFEFTTSTRAVDTPGSEQFSMYDKGFVALDAQDVAEKLAAELQADEEQDQERATSAGRRPFLGADLLTVQRMDESASSADFSFFDGPRMPPFRVSDGFTIEPNHSNLLSSAIVVDRSTTDDLTQVLVTNAGFEPPNPCIPSDPDILSKLMSVFPPTPDHRDLGHAVGNNLEKLQRFAEKRARRGSAASSSGRISDGSDKLVLELDGDQFEFLDKLGEGGFGAVFMARNMARASKRFEDDESDNDEEDEDDGLIAVKAVRPTNRWESFVLRRIASNMPDDLCRSIIRPHTLYAYKDESYLILDLCQQGTLLEIVNRATETGVAQPGGGVDELLVMFFTVELLRIIEGLHDCGFIHGDLKIDNCLIRLEDVPGGSSAWSSEYSPEGAAGWAHKGVKVIDFGRTIDTKLFPPGQTFIADWKTDARDCIEMRQGKPWTFQTDYSGLASIIYCMLFGKYMETVEAGGDGTRKPAQPMKRYWQADFWNRLFDALLNPCQVRADASLPITKELIALRTELEVWIQANCNKGGKNLKGMLKKIEIATLRRAPRK